MKNNIDDEINELLYIKKRIKEIEYIQQNTTLAIMFMSQCKYDELCSSNMIRDDILYYIIEPEIGQYIKDYVR